MVKATLLADAVTAHPDDAVARAVAYERASAREVEPWYHAAVMQDRRSRALAAGEPPDPEDPGAFFHAVLRDGLFPATRTDAVVLRAFVRAFNLLTPPDALMQDADVMGRVLAVFQDRDNRPPEPPLGPPRDEMLERIRPPAA